MRVHLPLPSTYRYALPQPPEVDDPAELDIALQGAAPVVGSGAWTEFLAACPNYKEVYRVAPKSPDQPIQATAKADES